MGQTSEEVEEVVENKGTTRTRGKAKDNSGEVPKAAKAKKRLTRRYKPRSAKRGIRGRGKGR